MQVTVNLTINNKLVYRIKFSVHQGFSYHKLYSWENNEDTNYISGQCKTEHKDLLKVSLYDQDVADQSTTGFLKNTG